MHFKGDVYHFLHLRIKSIPGLCLPKTDKHVFKRYKSNRYEFLLVVVFANYTYNSGTRPFAITVQLKT